MSDYRLIDSKRAEPVYTRADKLKDACVGIACWLLLTLLATYLHHVSSLAVMR